MQRLLRSMSTRAGWLHQQNMRLPSQWPAWEWSLTSSGCSEVGMRSRINNLLAFHPVACTWCNSGGGVATVCHPSGRASRFSCRWSHGVHIVGLSPCLCAASRRFVPSVRFLCSCAMDKGGKLLQELHWRRTKWRPLVLTGLYEPSLLLLRRSSHARWWRYGRLKA